MENDSIRITRNADNWCVEVKSGNNDTTLEFQTMHDLHHFVYELKQAAYEAEVGYMFDHRGGIEPLDGLDL